MTSNTHDGGVATRFGGYTVVARALSDAYKQWRPDGFRRQQIHVWWVRRDRNGFPDKQSVVVNGKRKELFDVSEVLSWFAGYTPSTGGRRTERVKSQDSIATGSQG